MLTLRSDALAQGTEGCCDDLLIDADGSARTRMNNIHMFNGTGGQKRRTRSRGVETQTGAKLEGQTRRKGAAA